MLAAASPNDGSAAAIIPDTPTTQARVRVTCVGNIFFDISNVNFTITAGGPVAPFVASVVPNSGSELGGTVVELTGLNFVDGATVEFGGVPAASVTFNDATSISATSPVHPPGEVAVVVTNPDAQSSNLDATFTFLPELPWSHGFETGDMSRWSLSVP